jgi:hypothetical protein
MNTGKLAGLSIILFILQTNPSPATVLTINRN